MKLFLLLFSVSCAISKIYSQNYIVTWTNDTVSCTFPNKPKKEGLKPAYKYENGYERVAAIFPEDSIRIIEAGQVKSYTRNEHGKGLLCNGTFYAKKIDDDSPKQIDETEKDKKWHFMQKVSAGPFATLYMQYSRANDGCILSSYYFSFPGDDPDYVVAVDSKKQAIKLLAGDAGNAPQIEKLKYRKSWKGYIDIVEGFNRLKQEAATK
ncbi:MAG: hypothetical protein V4722_13930 [Bacteroidota bacterium]